MAPSQVKAGAPSGASTDVDKSEGSMRIRKVGSMGFLNGGLDEELLENEVTFSKGRLKVRHRCGRGRARARLPTPCTMALRRPARAPLALSPRLRPRRSPVRKRRPRAWPLRSDG